MIDAAARAKQVLKDNQITDIPALALKDISKSEGIRFALNDYPMDLWDGTLLFKGDKRAILINTHKGNVGRHNFTFAHELGHYFLNHQPNFNHDGQPIIRCTASDIDNNQKTREVEANLFAVELLMPEDSFRLDMAGAPIDFELIGGLANRYMVSKHACSNHILGFTQAPCVIIRTNGINITGFAFSRAARGFLREMEILPHGTTAYTAVTEKRWDKDFTSCNTDKWLCRTIPGEAVYECTHFHRESGAAMTIIKW